MHHARGRCGLLDRDRSLFISIGIEKFYFYVFDFFDKMFFLVCVFALLLFEFL